MANIHRGEVTVSVAGRAYTLRPTFHILCQLEERIGLSITELLRRIGQKGLLASEILMILSVATHHDGSQPFDSAAIMDLPADDVDLHAVMPAISQFLMQGATASGYEELLETAYKVLRLEPVAFWDLTMPEFRILLRAARLESSVMAFPQAAELQNMMHRYPDVRDVN